MNKNIHGFFTVLFGGAVGGAIAAIILPKFLQNIGEYSNNISVFSMIFLGLLSGFTMGCIFLVKICYNHFFKRRGEIKIVHSIILIVILYVSIFLGLIFFGNYKLVTWLLLCFLFSLSIYIGFFNNYYSNKNCGIKAFSSILGSAAGGVFAGIIVSLAYIHRINFSIDEGYFILIMFLLCLIGAVVGITISIAIIIFEYISREEIVLIRSMLPDNVKFISIVLILNLLLPITAYNYWEEMGLNEDDVIDLETEKPFMCFSNNKATSMTSNVGYNNDLINFLESKPNKTIDVFAVLYLLTEDEKWANSFKKILLNEAQNRKFIEASGSVKGWQYYAMIRPYYYLLLTEKNPSLFTNSEQKLILDWFKEINEQAFNVEWVDYIYGFIFKKMPEGPYKNQEIGAGLLAVLSDVLKDEYPDLVEKDIKYLNNYGVGWQRNFRNPDDGIVYHQHIWVKNAYMMAKYGEQDKYLISNNTKNSFEWILLQWPSNGISPAYNIPVDNTPFDIMVLGGGLLNDGRYLWLAERMLEDEVKNIDREIDSIVGLEYWHNNITPIKPIVGSCYLKGTTGIAQAPKSLKPDKIILRDGWEYHSLYALINLRFSGWHSYKGTNSFVSIMHGEPFVVEKLESKQHKWIPKGKADHRDKKILREELNGFQMEKIGFEKIIYEITGLDSPWAQDPPRFSEVIAFNSTPIADYAITEISDWHGWTHQRASVLVKGDDPFIVVFDYAKGKKSNKVAITWHLKGDFEIGNQSIKLSQNNYSLFVYYPNLQNDCSEIKFFETNYTNTPAVEVHNSSIDLYLLSKGEKSEIYFVTLFYPLNEDKDIDNDALPNTLENISVTKTDEIVFMRSDNFTIKLDLMDGNIHVITKNE